jgi:hypothetical protein
MEERRGQALTERVTVNFSREQLERLGEYTRSYGEDLGGFIRRAALEKLAELGFGVDQKRRLGDLVLEARHTVTH